MISLVITSCGRPDLLERSLVSLISFPDLPFKQVIIIEDSGTDCNSEMEKLLPQFTWIKNKKRLGQIISIDRAYSHVKTPYILHTEDDWCFLKDGFVQPSIDILEKHPEVCMVGLRGIEDTMTQPVLKDRDYLYLDPTFKGHWHGFRFNPGLRRLSDWKKIGGYSKHTTFNFKSPADSEIDIAKVYYDMGMVAALLPEKYVEHIGRGRHVE